MIATAAHTKDELALHAWESNRLGEALRLLEECLAEKETADRWNNWASVQFKSGNTRAGELGFRRALEMEPNFGQAAANLGSILARDGKTEAAIAMLQRALQGNGVDDTQREAAKQMLAQCRATIAPPKRSLGEREAQGIILTNSLQRLEKRTHALENKIDELSNKLATGSYGGERIVASVGNDLWLTKVLNRFLMYVESADMSVAPYIVADGYWEKPMTDAFIERLRPGMTIVDVGANYGYYTLLAAGIVGTSGHVHSFEPNARTFELLTKNIQVNWLETIVSAHPVAALDSRKQVELHIPNEFQGRTTLFVPDGGPDCAQPSFIKAAPLDEIVTSRVDVIKIDAEGSEPLVFEGMQRILGNNPNLTIFMEFNIPLLRQTVHPRSFLNRIRQFGFSMQWFTPWNTLEAFDEEGAMKFDLFNLLLERK
jgi:FkbM family methyltransferase